MSTLDMSDKIPEKEVTIVLATLKEIADAVIHAAEAGTLKQVFQRIAFVAQQLVRSRYAALGIPSPDRKMLYFEVAGLEPDAIRSIPHPPVGRGLLGLIMEDREVLRLEHLHEHPRSVGFPENHPRMDRLLGVPVQSGEHLFGMLYLTDRLDDQPFSQEDQWLVESLAGYAALAIAGSQLTEQRGRLMLLEERERVGMELHDGVIQSLYAIGMQLQLLKLSKPDVAAEVTTATRSLDAVIEDIRRYILNLKAVNYEQQTIRACLAGVIARLYIPEGLHVTVLAPDHEPPFAPPVVEAMCQIAYEAVSNIVRHARATEATVEVTEEADHFRLAIHDNGRGFSPDETAVHDGLGLHNMMRRARSCKGTISIDSAPGSGTRLHLDIPLQRKRRTP
jgi:signal transduction histidine kinase